MAKRKLSQKQTRRIRNKQTQHADKTNNREPTRTGQQQEGLVTAHHGTFVTVEAVTAETVTADSFAQETTPLSSHTSPWKTQRCHFRTNLGSLVTGDRVVWQEGDPYGVVLAVLPRQTELSRPDPYTQKKVVAANVDQLAIVIAPLPKPHTHIIDRYIVAAETMGVRPLIVINKAELPEAASEVLGHIESHYPSLGYRVLRCSAHQNKTLTSLALSLQGHTSIFVGQSGVGKSSLINTLIPDLDLQVGEISDYNSKGKHTTTHSQLFRLASGGQIIDSPGIREFGLWHLDKHTILEGFTELREVIGHCKFRDCQHQQEPGCAIQQALDEGKMNPYRIDSLRALLKEAENGGSY